VFESEGNSLRFNPLPDLTESCRQLFPFTVKSPGSNSALRLNRGLKKRMRAIVKRNAGKERTEGGIGGRRKEEGW